MGWGDNKLKVISGKEILKQDGLVSDGKHIVSIKDSDPVYLAVRNSAAASAHIYGSDNSRICGAITTTLKSQIGDYNKQIERLIRESDKIAGQLEKSNSVNSRAQLQKRLDEINTRIGQLNALNDGKDLSAIKGTATCIDYAPIAAAALTDIGIEAEVCYGHIIKAKDPINATLSHSFVRIKKTGEIYDPTNGGFYENNTPALAKCRLAASGKDNIIARGNDFTNYRIMTVGEDKAPISELAKALEIDRNNLKFAQDHFNEKISEFKTAQIKAETKEALKKLDITKTDFSGNVPSSSTRLFGRSAREHNTNLQIVLNNAGILTYLAKDGIAGSQTKAAFQDFLENNGLSAIGQKLESNGFSTASLKRSEVRQIEKAMETAISNIGSAQILEVQIEHAPEAIRLNRPSKRSQEEVRKATPAKEEIRKALPATAQAEVEENIRVLQEASDGTKKPTELAFISPSEKGKAA